MKYAILTFGCRVNQADSFDIERDLRARGAEEAPLDEADVIVVNTCSVTAIAEQAARQAIRRAARGNPLARIVATGCYAVRRPGDLQALPVWRVGSEFGARSSPLDFARPFPPPGTRGRTLYLLRAQTGCDERCSYCSVPGTRGPGRSTPLSDIVQEVSLASAAGFKEVTITGVHLGSYGRDFACPTSLTALVRALASHPADVRFRLSAIEPMDFGEDLVAAIAGCGRFAPHFHLPMQHASDRILSAMARPYTLASFERTVNRLRDRFPDASLGSDVIVGFPGETAGDFDECVRYVERSPLTYIHVFPFSPRPGTAAASLGGRPNGAVVRERVTHLRALASDLGRRFRARFVGTERDGLTIEDGSLVLTDNYLRVRVPPGRTRNERVRVKIEKDGGTMSGQVVD